ncbi:BbrUII/HgiDII family restriction enzyme [Parerythrobacter jejuensis]|uniref:Heat-shock protein n=1 Tax=Parerythrobacter jejuensis TaxID=795812 RepID=A0A845AQJ2_9SPHN|nr:ATP-binding protein [Parerythrobacter jejuensis]MXP32570.1 heat-shock protein [Parerythrobacter jejuensis]
MSRKTTEKYELTISLNSLEHLGINLYSNMAAVLSEIVANAYDADAERVDISWDSARKKIVITDDGLGMTEEEVNQRFLTVGYRRRSGQPGLTPKHKRKPMGRKGIGKLSLFSIADTVVVETAKDGEKSAFKMHLPDIRKKIEAGGNDSTTYTPKEVGTDKIDFVHGTRITLTNLRRRQTLATPKALKKRVARRFQVIESPKFRVYIDDEEVKVDDREYYDKLQYIWTYGQQKDVVARAKNIEHHEKRATTTAPGGVTISGWLGTVKESSQLKDDDDDDNLNRIAIFVRGKMAQEDILDAFTERGVYAGYLIGELRVDGLDLWVDEKSKDDDAATSSRQNLVEGDPRYVELKKFIAAELKHIQTRWAALRVDSGAKNALKIPVVKEWIDTLKPATRTKAKQWIGKLNKIEASDTEEKSLIKQSVLAFEFHRLNENLDRLENITDEGVPTLLELFSEVDGLEANLYGQIVKSRVGVLRALEEKVDGNALEKVIQKYLFDHLWLIDPAWERADSTEYMERRVEKVIAQVTSKLSAAEKKARIDIGYRKTAGKHVIVELKRPNVVTTSFKLAEQVSKYRSGMTKVLKKADLDKEPVEIVIVLGKPPSDWANPGGETASQATLNAQGARIIFYENLLETSSRIYADYLAHRKDVDKLQKLMAAIDDFSAT